MQVRTIIYPQMLNFDFLFAAIFIIIIVLFTVIFWYFYLKDVEKGMKVKQNIAIPSIMLMVLIVFFMMLGMNLYRDFRTMAVLQEYGIIEKGRCEYLNDEFWNIDEYNSFVPELLLISQEDYQYSETLKAEGSFNGSQGK